MSFYLKNLSKHLNLILNCNIILISNNSRTLLKHGINSKYLCFYSVFETFFNGIQATPFCLIT